MPERADNTSIRPFRLATPSGWLFKNPELTLIAKLSKRGRQAVLTSTSPACSGISRRRIGGIATGSVASERNAASTWSMAARSSGTKARNCVAPRMEMDDISRCPDEMAMQFDIDIAATDNDHERPAL